MQESTQNPLNNSIFSPLFTRSSQDSTESQDSPKGQDQAIGRISASISSVRDRLSQFTSATRERIDYISDLIKRNSPFYVDFSEISLNPTTILTDLLPHMATKFPRIQYLNSPALDLGGITRDFITNLFLNLYAKDAPKLPVLKDEKGLFPMVKANSAEEHYMQMRCYRSIGNIFGYALLGCRSISTGHYFHPIVFEIISSLTQSDLDCLPSTLNSIKDVPSWTIEKIFPIYSKHLKLSEEEAQNVLNDTFTEEFSAIYGSENRAEFLKDFEVNNVFLAILQIAKSMNECTGRVMLPKQRGVMGKTSSEKLRNAIEGNSASPADVISVLKWNAPNSLTRPLLEVWLKTTSHENVQNFLFAITGSYSLMPGRTISVETYGGRQERLPTFRTCFLQIRISKDYSNYDQLKQKLEQAIEASLSTAFELT